MKKAAYDVSYNFAGGWYETTVRPYGFLYWRRHDMGADYPEIVPHGVNRDCAFDCRV